MSRNWQARPRDPTARFYGYNQNSEWDKPSIIERTARRIRPSLNQVAINDSYWRDSIPAESDKVITFQLSAEMCGITTDGELEAHLKRVRKETWQIVQDFSIARWWFLRSILIKNPFYGEIREQVRSGATVVDLGCGLGQELRFLRADGASGKMYGVDERKQMWDLGLELFNDPGSNLEFRLLDIVEENRKKDGTRVENPLFEFKEKADVYLLNDFLTFLGPIATENTLKSIARASRVGTKIIGWTIGQDGNEVSGMNIWGTGLRGSIHNSRTFRMNWPMVEGVTETKWDLEVKMVEFEELGFDEIDCRWFAGNYFKRDQLSGEPEKLMGLCFLATRID